MNKKQKEGFFIALATVIKKDSTTSIRKYANELKVHKKTVKTAIEQDLKPDLNHFDYAIWDILENKTNATSDPNIGGARGVMVIVVGNGYDDTSSNPGPG